MFCSDLERIPASATGSVPEWRRGSVVKFLETFARAIGPSGLRPKVPMHYATVCRVYATSVTPHWSWRTSSNPPHPIPNSVRYSNAPSSRGTCAGNTAPPALCIQHNIVSFPLPPSPQRDGSFLMNSACERGLASL
jgi:hypothetical protein